MVELGFGPAPSEAKGFVFHATALAFYVSEKERQGVEFMIMNVTVATNNVST